MEGGFSMYFLRSITRIFSLVLALYFFNISTAAAISEKLYKDEFIYNELYGNNPEHDLYDSQQENQTIHEYHKNEIQPKSGKIYIQPLYFD